MPVVAYRTDRMDPYTRDRQVRLDWPQDLIQGIRDHDAKGSVPLDDHGVPVDLSTTEGDAAYDPVVRLNQPVNAAVTLAQGRRLAAELAQVDGGQRELGRALQGLYTYLDQLYGRPGAFTELVAPAERVLLAQRTPKR